MSRDPMASKASLHDGSQKDSLQIEEVKEVSGSYAYLNLNIF